MLLDARGVPRSPWLRRHARSAIILGTLACLALLIVLGLPATLIACGAVSLDHAVGLYAWAFALDLLTVGVVVATIARCARRAGRGEAFTLASLLPIRKEDRAS